MDPVFGESSFGVIRAADVMNSTEGTGGGAPPLRSCGGCERGRNLLDHRLGRHVEDRPTRYSKWSYVPDHVFMIVLLLKSW